MSRRALPLFAVLIATLAGVARADEDPRTALEFEQALREKGFFDLAGDYLEKLRSEKSTPEEIRTVIDYEFGRLLIDEAAKTGDLVRRKELLEQARSRLETFTKAQPNHELASEALVQLARLLVERGHLAVLLGEETEDKAEKNAKLVEARTSFDQARAAYVKADERLTAEFKAFPNFVPDDDPRKAKRDRSHAAMMDAELQKAIVDYEQGQTYPARLQGAGRLPRQGAQAVRGDLQELPDPVGRLDRADVAGQVLRGGRGASARPWGSTTS